MVGIVCHTVVVLALVAAYVTVTTLGHDGTALLGVLGGYLGGAGFQGALERAGANGSPTKRGA